MGRRYLRAWLKPTVVLRFAAPLKRSAPATPRRTAGFLLAAPRERRGAVKPVSDRVHRTTPALPRRGRLTASWRSLLLVWPPALVSRRGVPGSLPVAPSMPRSDASRAVSGRV
jgi:hypothetical protein